MDDMVTFLRARLDEDEAVAKTAAEVAGPVWVPVEEEFGTFHPMGLEEKVSRWAYDSEEKATHIARHDPARVLRDVESKRQIMELMEGDLRDEYPWSAGQVLAYLALPYSDHPDYRQDWKP